MQSNDSPRNVETIVIGGGQAGLVTGYWLSQLGQECTILDANARIGDAWRNRWDSLRLFTVARNAGLPGFPFPAPANSFPSKDEVADYLEAYARRFGLGVRTGTRVEGLRREGSRFIVETTRGGFDAENVVVAMAPYQTPKTPELAAELKGSILQMHASEYRNPSQLREGPTLVVGVGNSGAEIALEVSRTHPVWLAGAPSGVIPWPIESWFGRVVGSRLFRLMFHHVLRLDTAAGRKAHAKTGKKAPPLVRVKLKTLAAAGVERTARIVEGKRGLPVTADGRMLDAANVIWCTGYQRNYGWIDLPIFGADGEPEHDRGVVAREPGLYFVGLHWQYAASSATLIGVGRDAEHVARRIAARPVAAPDRVGEQEGAQWAAR